jgi:hypothetical protein
MTAYIKGKTAAHVTLTGDVEDVLCPWGRRGSKNREVLFVYSPAAPAVPWCTRCQTLMRARLTTDYAPALPEVAKLLSKNGRARKATTAVK